ncbi:hypothetical protein TNIN_370071 [Trichonephila inaurata madagascariensis]|uniref:Uncharacterized protein n=1 Tax=Trichonephila inaurata madagascariensis TaxID=2747483 RepID=A0A8X6X9L9_9ARAC|nr:hypothetical protein TNIN_370071 [Trichonephila inaurata madagascariensis]
MKTKIPDALPTGLSGLVANMCVALLPSKEKTAVSLFKGLYSGTSDGSFGRNDILNFFILGFDWLDGIMRSTWTTSLSFLFREAGSKFCTS